ncbi:MAG: GNAT family N-acetyltransferase [Candidatus Kapaibacterium sp.]
MPEDISRLGSLLAEWIYTTAPGRPALAQNILGSAQSLAQENAFDHRNKDTWRRFLDLTGRPDFLSALSDANARNDWAETAFVIIRNINYNTREMFDRAAADNPGQILFQDMSASTPLVWSYEQTRRHVREIAAVMYSMRPESPRVAIWSENSVESASCDIACLCYDILVSPLNTHFGESELEEIFRMLDINIVVADTADRMKKLLKLRNESGLDFDILTTARIPTDADDVYFLGELCKKMGIDEIAEILSRRRQMPIDEVCTVMFTSGSTGRPKGISFSQYNLITKRFARAAAVPQVGENEVMLCYLPLFHTFGRYLEMMGAIFWRATYVMAGNPSAETLLELFPKVNPTIFISIPLRWAQLYDRAIEKMDTSADESTQLRQLRLVVGGRLKWGLSAAGYLDPRVFNFFEKNNIYICSGFGMTEATGGITMTPPGAYIDNTNGIPLPGIYVELGEMGEMQLRGHYLARYYEDSPIGSRIPFPESAEADWKLATGDIFRRLGNGYYEIIDRIKDIYKNNKGQTIAPQRVEKKFLNVPGIKRTFLVGDGRPYNVLFIVPDYDDVVLRAYEGPDNIREYFHQITNSANSDLAPYERVINFTLLDRDFSVDHDELTAKGSYKRKNIEHNFREMIDKLYEKDHAELSVAGLRIIIPRWLFRDMGILEDDLVAAPGGIFNKSDNSFLKITQNSKSHTYIIGHLEYTLAAHEFNLGTFARQPRLWAGNPSLAAFCPCKEGWDTRTDGINTLVLLPLDRDTDVAGFQPNVRSVRSQQLITVNELLTAALFMDAPLARAAIEKLEDYLGESGPRIVDIIRSRIQALARHPEEDIRCMAYRVLLLDDPDPDYSSAFPAFIKSGLTFLNERSVGEIAANKLERRRLEALRQRLYSYRTQLDWPASDITNKQFEKIFRLLVNFATNNPEYYNSVRAELASWILHRADPLLSESAEKYFTELYLTYENGLENRSPKYSRSEWDRCLVFEDGLSDTEITRIRGVITGPTFLMQSVMLAFEEDDFSLDIVPDEGIWISRIQALHNYMRYRVSISTAIGKHYDLQLVLRENLKAASVIESVFWLVAVANYPYGPRILPQLGCCRPEIEARSLQYIGDLTVWERIRQFSGIQRSAMESPLASEWRNMFVEAMAAFYKGWRNSGYQIVPGAVSPGNVVVPELNFHEGAIISSLTGWEYYKNKLSLIGPMLRNFYKRTIAHYPWCRSFLNTDWIFDACMEAFEPDFALTFLNELKNDLSGRSMLCPDGRELAAHLEDYLARLGEHFYTPLSLLKAADRYDSWISINPNASAAAREQTIRELYRLYRLDRYPEIVRYYIYRTTYFANSEKDVVAAFDKLLGKMSADVSTPATHLIELSDLQSVITAHDDKEVFSRMVFPQYRPERRIRILKVGERDQVVVNTSISDKTGAKFTIREPIEPAEIGHLYRLFVNENYPKTVSTDDRHLVVLDSHDRIVGGLSWREQEDDSVLLDGTVVAGTLKGRGIGSAMIEDFCMRMAQAGKEVIKTHYFLREFYLSLGFHVDKKYGALVKFLSASDAKP